MKKLPKNILKLDIQNYDGPDYTNTFEITDEEILKYRSIINAINVSAWKRTWNWMSSIPDKWDGSKFVDDIYVLEHFKLVENFGKDKVDPHLFIEFFHKFTPTGADRISCAEVFKVIEEKIDINSL